MQDVILTHEDIFEGEARNLAAFTRHHYRRNGNGIPSNEIHGEVLARVDDGKWIADCPSPVCNAASMVSKDDRRFICCECGSSDNLGRWRSVIFPENMEQIEAALLARPGWLNRGAMMRVGLLSGGPRFWSPVDIAAEMSGGEIVIMQRGQALEDLLHENEEIFEMLDEAGCWPIA